MVTDSLPAVALALDPESGDIMTKRKRSDTALFPRQTTFNILAEGAMIGAIALLAYTLGAIFFDKSGSLTVGRTMAFVVLASSQLVHAFNLRSEGSVLNSAFFKNKVLLLSCLFGIVLTASLTAVPKTALLFGVTTLPPSAWCICGIFSIFPLLIVELGKKAELKFTKRENIGQDF